MRLHVTVVSFVQLGQHMSTWTLVCAPHLLLDNSDPHFQTLIFYLYTLVAMYRADMHVLLERYGNSCNPILVRCSLSVHAYHVRRLNYPASDSIIRARHIWSTGESIDCIDVGLAAMST
jgi:hypothetical protein